MQRREFLVRSAQLGLVVSVTGSALLACDESNDPDGMGGDDDCSNGADVEYLNPIHPHAVIGVSALAISNGVPVTLLLLDESASQRHDHTFSLTAQDFTDLENGLSVTKTSSGGTGSDHTHQVRITC